LATIFCAKEASVAIKSYSPELMVDSVYEASKMIPGDSNIDEVNKMVERVTSALDRIHILIIGPGLGRNDFVLDATAKIIKQARRKGVSMVLDADALYLLSLPKYHYLIEELSGELELSSSSGCRVVLTPNIVEYKRLVDHIADGSEDKIHKLLPGVAIVKKGHCDTITCFSRGATDESASYTTMISEEKGGLKRSGGIGDILAGCIGTFVAWNTILAKQQEGTASKENEIGETASSGNDVNLVLSCWVACSITKRATRLAFENRKRSMTAPDILEELGGVVHEVASSTIR